MIRLHLTVEGQTEQAFLKGLLAPHLGEFGVFAVARCVLTSKDRRSATEYRGGLFKYEKAKNDLLTWMKEDSDPECRFTTMFDLYALPKDFPGYRDAARASDPYERIRILEDAFKNDIDDRRFIPYIQLHEFEALIFSDLRMLVLEYPGYERQVERLVQIAEGKNPELINNGTETAPSKRILKEIAEYEKVIAGVSVLQKIRLPKLRECCSHFNEWVGQLESLGNAGGCQ